MSETDGVNSNENAANTPAQPTQQIGFFRGCWLLLVMLLTKLIIALWPKRYQVPSPDGARRIATVILLMLPVAYCGNRLLASIAEDNALDAAIIAVVSGHATDEQWQAYNDFLQKKAVSSLEEIAERNAKNTAWDRSSVELYYGEGVRGPDGAVIFMKSVHRDNRDVKPYVEGDVQIKGKNAYGGSVVNRVFTACGFKIGTLTGNGDVPSISCE